MLSGLRGLAQSVVRGAVRIGLAIQDTYTAIASAGLGYVEATFVKDYDTYSVAYEKTQQLLDLDKDYLVPGEAHSKSIVNLSTEFKYDVKTTWETLEGKTIEQFTSVSAQLRMTQTEIEEVAATQMEKYVPEGAIFHGEYEIEGAWYK